jgi:glycosyltransferase involved in cell wall biosynthesis
MDPLVHYLRCGAAEGRDPNPFFDSDWYLEKNPDVASSGTNPLVHYLRSGAAQGRDPSPLFDSDSYRTRNPEIAAAGINPVLHYMRGAAVEGRSCGAPTSGILLTHRVPTISAIIPCYNGAPWLAEALKSIREQTYPVDEIIVVDDGSSDNSGDIARQYGASVLRNLSNRGEGYSRNVGLRHATGELVAWLDADDLWKPHHVRTLAGLLQNHPQATSAFGAVQRFGLRNELIRGYVPLGEPTNVFWLAFRDWVHTTIGSMTRREALLEIGGFNEQERYSVDFDLWLRLSRSHLFVCTHDVTSCWRWHDAQQSTQLDRQVAALYRFRRSYYERERAIGDAAVAVEMERRMVEIWHEDMQEAWEKRDLAQLRFLYGLAPLIPALPAHLQSDWRQRIPE